MRLPIGKIRVFVKGAPEIVIEHCTKTLDATGKVIELSSLERDDIINVSVVKQFAAKCYRTLLIAYVDYSETDWENLRRSNNNF